MVDAVNTTAVITYQSNMVMALQPKGGELMGTCLEGDLSGELAELDDIFGAAQTKTIRGRHEPTEFTEATQDRVWLAKPDADYYARPVDKHDQLQAQVDLKGGYVIQGSGAIKRYWNQQWINGFLGTRQTGKKGTIITPFPTGQIIAPNVGFGASGSNHMCIEKFIQARQVLALGDADLDVTDAYMMITPIQMSDLIREVQVTSDEFAGAYKSRIRQDGGIMKLDSFMGFVLIELNLASPLYSGRAPTTEVVSSQPVRKCPFWLKNGVYAGYWERLFTDIGIRADIHFATVVYARSAMAVTRTQDGLSGYIQCFEG